MFKPVVFAAVMGAISLPVLAEDMTLHERAGHSVTVGDLTLSDGWMRATTSVARSSGGFLTIKNEGDMDERLLRAAADFAMVQLHETVTVDGVNRMQEQTGGIVIPAGQSVSLMPGSYHMMFMAMEEGLPMGATRDVVLFFEKAGEVTVTLPAQMGGHAMSHDDGGHGDGAGHGSANH